jgi:hypothetical protein
MSPKVGEINGHIGFVTNFENIYRKKWHLELRPFRVLALTPVDHLVSDLKYRVASVSIE